jgi:hypothetical protein
VKLSEIREKYLSLHLSTSQATKMVIQAGIPKHLAAGVVTGWIREEWDESLKGPAEKLPALKVAHVTYQGRQYKLTIEEE